eukprot:g1784.t1
MEFQDIVLRCFLFDLSLSPDCENASLQERAESILFYSPAEESTESKVSIVNLATGMIEFNRTFNGTNKDSSVNVVQTSEYTYALRECEPDIWLVLSLQTPQLLEMEGEKLNYFVRRKLEQQLKEEHKQQTLRYQKAVAAVAASVDSAAITMMNSENDLDNRSRSYKREESVNKNSTIQKSAVDDDAFSARVLDSVLEELHAQFVLFNGSLLSLVRPKGKSRETLVDDLQEMRKKVRKAREAEVAIAEGDRAETGKLRKLISSIPELEQQLERLEERSPLPDLRRKLAFGMSTALVEMPLPPHVFHSMKAHHFCPIDRITYLSIQYFIGLLRNRFSEVSHLGFFFDRFLVWHNLPSNKLLGTLYRAMQGNTIRTLIDKAQQMSFPFVLEADGSLFIRDVYCNSKLGTNFIGNMVFFQEGRVTLLLVLNPLSFESAKTVSNSNNFGEFRESFTSEMRIEARKLGVVIGEQHARISSSSPTSKSSTSSVSALAAGASLDDGTSPMFIYCNHTNSAMKIIGFPKLKETSKRKQPFGLPQQPPSLELLTSAVSPTSLRILDSMHEYFWQRVDTNDIFITKDLKNRPMISTCKETYIRTYNGAWVIGLQSGSRELFVFLGKERENLADAETGLRDLCERNFFNIMLS